MKTANRQLPSNWEWCRIRDAYDFTQKPRGLDLKKNGKIIPFFTMAQIPRSQIHVSEFTPKPVDKLGSGTYVEKGDVMIAKITPCFENGKQAIVDINADFAYATTEVIPLNGVDGKADNLFLFFYLRHPRVRAELASKMEGTTGRQRLSKSVLGERLMPLPPLPEQKKIAHILSTVQRAIDVHERITQTATELKKGLMQKLFTEGMRGEPRKETKIGWIPESWGVVELGTLFDKEPQNGLYKPKEDYGAGTQILRIEDFSNEGDIVVRSRNRVALSPDEIATYGLEAGDIIINRVNSLSHLGKTAMIGEINEEIVFESNMMRFSLDESNVHKGYVFKFLNSPFTRKQIVSIAKRAISQSSINQGDVKSILIPKPSFEEQTEIAKILEAIESKIAGNMQKTSTLQDLFRALLHDLMTARIRVDNLITTFND